MRLLAFMTTAACAIAGGACSGLLGLDDPKPNVDGGGGGDGGGGADAGPSPERLELRLASFTLKQGQRVGLHVTAVYADGTMEDATTTATYTSTNPSVADVVERGYIDGVAQGTAMISAAIGTSQPAIATVTVRPASCSPVINEFQAAGAGGADDEWVEILNPCAAPITVEGWTLVYRGSQVGSGGSDSALLVTLKGSIASGAIRLYAGPSYTPGSTQVEDSWTNGTLGGRDGAIALRTAGRDMGTLADSVSYGTVIGGHTFTEMMAAPPMVSGSSAQRLPFDGHDEDNNMADFKVLTTKSPGAPNAP